MELFFIIFPDSIVVRLGSKVKNMLYDKYSQQFVKICQRVKIITLEECSVGRGIFGA